MAKVVEKTQITAWLDNKPGQMAKLGRALKRGKVNMTAMSVIDTVDHSGVRMVVDNAAAAKKALTRAKVPFSTRRVLLLTMTNKVGALGQVGAKLAKGGVNLDYAYGSTHPKQDDALVVVACDNVSKAARLLR